MNMYEVILNIIDQKGPVSIPSICQEINQNRIFMQERDKPVQPSQIKSAISRKRDLFYVENNIVSLLPEKELISLTVQISYGKGPWIKVDVDFIEKNFVFFEWNLEPVSNRKYEPIKAGSTDDFKHSIFRLKVWDWEINYDQEGIILDGINWAVRLETKAKVYKSDGLQDFPKDWTKFCQALRKLTGKKFL